MDMQAPVTLLVNHPVWSKDMVLRHHLNGTKGISFEEQTLTLIGHKLDPEVPKRNPWWWPWGQGKQHGEIAQGAARSCGVHKLLIIRQMKNDGVDKGDEGSFGDPGRGKVVGLKGEIAAEADGEASGSPGSSSGGVDAARKGLAADGPVAADTEAADEGGTKDDGGVTGGREAESQREAEVGNDKVEDGDRGEGTRKGEGGAGGDGEAISDVRDEL